MYFSFLIWKCSSIFYHVKEWIIYYYAFSNQGLMLSTACHVWCFACAWATRLSLSIGSSKIQEDCMHLVDYITLWRIKFSGKITIFLVQCTFPVIGHASMSCPFDLKIYRIGYVRKTATLLFYVHGCGRYPPEVRTAIPVDGRFEHIVLSCTATLDHAIIQITNET